eukprot:scaffold80784_cov29-Tisochrysis_lutea.AAC.3
MPSWAVRCCLPFPRAALAPPLADDYTYVVTLPFFVAYRGACAALGGAVRRECGRAQAQGRAAHTR